MYQLNLHKVQTILQQADLLKEIIVDHTWYFSLPLDYKEQQFTTLSYDSRTVDSETLFFCKGAGFKESFLTQAIEQGLTTYIAQSPFDVDAIGFIVTDIRKAMALLAQEFYQHPQKKLIKIGITGTKGKTTAAYFLKDALAKATHHKVALFSSEETCLDGTTYTRSHLTTPEALELYAQMAIAVEHKVTHLVMEVSSQAYKTKRVYGLNFEVGIFLNIGTDHISPIEHPTFDDYLYCKRQLIQNSQQMILNQDMDYFDLLADTATLHHVPYVTFGRTNEAMIQIQDHKDTRNFDLQANELDMARLEDEYQLGILGTFNHDNAVAALLAMQLLGFHPEIAHQTLKETVIPGRMHVIEQHDQPLVLVDFAHNYLSIKAIGELAHQLRPDGRVLILTGSTGGKALGRREDIAKALSEVADEAILTSDDPDFEDPFVIATEIKEQVTSDIPITIEVDREKAITMILEHATKADVVAICGKGTEQSMKINGRGEPYSGDITLASRWFND